MKRFISIVMSLIILSAFCVTAFADTTDNVELTVEIGDFTIIFDENTTLSEEQRFAVAQKMVNTDVSQVAPHNLICTLFGHDKKTETVIIIEHKVSATNPRCVKKFEDLTTCSRCDYVEMELLSSMFISCCD